MIFCGTRRAKSCESHKITIGSCYLISTFLNWRVKKYTPKLQCKRYHNKILNNMVLSNPSTCICKIELKVEIVHKIETFGTVCVNCYFQVTEKIIAKVAFLGWLQQKDSYVTSSESDILWDTPRKILRAP